PTATAGKVRFNQEQGDAIRRELQKKGYNDVQIAAAMGHWHNESSFNTTALGDNGTSYGLAQWHKDRWAGLNDYSRRNGLDPSTVQAQVGYFDYELSNN